LQLPDLNFSETEYHLFAASPEPVCGAAVGAGAAKIISGNILQLLNRLLMLKHKIPLFLFFEL